MHRGRGCASTKPNAYMRKRTKTHASVKKHTETHACRHVYTRACWSKTGPVLASRPCEKRVQTHTRTQANTRSDKRLLEQDEGLFLLGLCVL